MDKFKEIMLIVAEKSLPKRRSSTKVRKNTRKPNKKWFDHSCHAMKTKLLKRYPNDPYARGKLITTYKEYRKLIKRKNKEWQNLLIEKLQEFESSNPKEYWKLIKSLRECNLGGDANNESDSVDPGTWFDYFKALNSSPEFRKSSFQINVEMVSKNYKQFAQNVVGVLDSEISLQEVKSEIQKLKNNKTSGNDSFANEMIKASSDVILPTLLNREYFPKMWSVGFIVPIYKSDGCDNPSNYRGITITSCVGKLFTSVINQRIIKFVEKQRVVSHHQYLHKGKKLYLCFVDFKKAYDSVRRNGVFYKLINCGFSTKILGILKSLYDNTLSCVKFSRGLTNSFKSSVGVCQGCNLSPVLFNIFINDLIKLFSPSDHSCFPVKLKSVSLNCLLYADELLLMSETETGIQNCLNNLHVYCKKWCLKINMKNTQTW